MKLGIDLDGVLANFVDAHTEVIKRQTGVELPPLSDVWPTEWDYDKAAGLTGSQRSKVWEEIKSTYFWAQLLPLAGGPEAIKRLNVLQQAGHDIYYITSRPGTFAKLYTQFWLTGYGAESPTVILSSKKGYVAAGLELDVMVEDKPENNLEIVQTMGANKVRTYLLDKPYNKWAHSQPLNYGRVVKDIHEALDVEFSRQGAEREAA